MSEHNNDCLRACTVNGNGAIMSRIQEVKLSHEELLNLEIWIVASS